ncbi:MAG: ECF transporter S component [Clostridia bacterium]|nr:ECF transporter S component [Clostridia bacterium]
MKWKRGNFFSARNIAFLAVLVALVVVLQLWGSTIPVGAGGLNLSFVLVPLTLGAILLGPIAGLILGFVFGFVVLMTGVTGTNFFTAYVLNDSPFFTTVTVLLKGMAAGFVAGILFNVIKKKNKFVAVFVAAASVPVINTGIFILGALCMSGTLNTFVSSYMPNFAGRNIMYIIIVGLVTVNFFIEFAINLICAPALYTVETVVEKQLLKKYKKQPKQEDNQSEKSEV